MNNTTKRSVVVSAILAVVLCVSLIAGATYALFTSESSVNVAVTSGKVSVVANVDQDSLTMYSPTGIATDGTITDDTNAAHNGQFANGGTVVVDGETITVSGMTPGDSVSFDITVKNNSTVAVKYRTILSAVDNDGMLANGLEITIDDDDYTGATNVSPWAELAANTDPDTVHVTIALPTTATTCQGKTLSLTYAVSAVQGNVVTEDPADDTYYVYTPVDLVAYANSSKLKATYKKVAIVNNINMSGIAWNPIHVDPWNKFEIIGNNKTITGLTNALVSAGAEVTLKISNLTINAANICANTDLATDNGMGAAALVAAIEGGSALSLTECHVTNSIIRAERYTNANNIACEPCVAGLVGYISNGSAVNIIDCTVSNCTIEAADDAAGLIGFIMTDANIQNCHVKGATNISCTADNGGYAAKAGKLIGTVNAGAKLTLTGCTADDTVTVSNVNAKEPFVNGLVGRVVNAQVIIGDDVWTTHTVLKGMLQQAGLDLTLEYNYHLCEPHGKYETAILTSKSIAVFNDNASLTWKLNGNGHTIYGLARPLISKEANGTITISELTISNAYIQSTAAQSGECGTAAFVAFMDVGANLNLSNCTLVDSYVEGLEENVRTAGLVGYVSQGTATITGCKVVDSTIKSADGASAILNCTYATTTISNCEVSGTSIESTETRNGYNRAHTAAVVGTVQGTSATTISGTTVAADVAVTRAGTAQPVHAWVGRVISDSTGNGSVEIDGTVYTSAAAVKAVLLADNGQGLQKNYHVIGEWDSLTGADEISGSGIVINGNNKTIYGLTAPLIDYITYNVNIYDLTIADSNICDYVDGYYYAGAFIAYAEQNNINISGCHVVNSVIGTDNTKYVGGFVGYYALSNLSISGCSVDSDTVIKNRGDGSLGGIVGFNYTHSTCSQVISNCTVAATFIGGEYTNGSNWIGSIVGTVCQGEENDDGVLEIVLPEGKTFDNSYYGRIVNTTIKCGGKTYTSNAAALATALKSTDATINVVLTSDINLSIGLLNNGLTGENSNYIGGSGQYRLGGGSYNCY